MAEQTQTPTRAAQRAAEKLMPRGVVARKPIHDKAAQLRAAEIDEAIGLPDVEQALEDIAEKAERWEATTDGMTQIRRQAQQALAQLRGEQGEADE